MTKSIEQMENEIAIAKAEHDARLTRRSRYRATRSHYPNRAARDVLIWVRSQAPYVKQYPKTSGVYNPRFVPDWTRWTRSGGHYRWVENTNAGGLRWVGYADEIASRAINHKGWFTDPAGDFTDEVLRGAVWQLPARNGRAQYVHGYVDPWNDGAALICFDIDEGERGGADGGHEDATFSAAYNADEVARLTAGSERDYRAKDEAEQRAAELRDEAKETRRSLCDTIRQERDRIAELLREADELMDNPYSLYH